MRALLLVASLVVAQAIANPALAQGAAPLGGGTGAALANTPATVLPDTCAKPLYPQTSIQQRESGRSVILLSIGARGTVVATQVETSSGSKRLDRATQEAFQSCRFKPARDATGANVSSALSMPFDWRIEDAPPDPWVAMRAVQGAGFAAPADLSAVVLEGSSAMSSAQRATVMTAMVGEAKQKAGCPSMERLSVRKLWASPAAEARVLELWTAVQCGQTLRYLAAFQFPSEGKAWFLMTPLPASETLPL